MSEQVFIILINCIVRGLNRNGKQITGYVTKHWLTVGLRHTHTHTHTHFAVLVPNTVSCMTSLVVVGSCVRLSGGLGGVALSQRRRWFDICSTSPPIQAKWASGLLGAGQYILIEYSSASYEATKNSEQRPS
ncbi:hypothetical protein F441_07982 [Phytophthora nicotianae CJ01A1]|uniref:Uncharacterized protein n=2 Tax=Phytophthora nicotianae TaxID=4792 RepID=W2GZP9_PHYNI|nr:hypothetical protein L915_07838 [Phytophthora nicotianae]ETL41214.1 hypothetical protein L916_07768 [Phytophthora nicotianae]ETP17702.1 hypothetical protein F441_07982 [Phytophthora nicotianae CJ01A1]